MTKLICTLTIVFISLYSFSQKPLGDLTVEKIMRDPKWMGSSPSNPFWSNEDQLLFFSWNPDNKPGDSIYSISLSNKTPVKVDALKSREIAATGTFIYNSSRTTYIFLRDGDIYLKDLKTNKTKQITQTTDFEGNPSFSFNEAKIVYSRSQNLFAWDIATGETMQLTNLRAGNDAGTRPTSPNLNPQEQWLKNDQLRYFEVLKDRKQKREETEAYNKNIRPKELRSINIDDKSLQGLGISPDGRFISYRLFKPAAGVKNTIVPSYVTESGFTTDINARSKVGGAQGTTEFFIYDRVKDTVVAIKADSTIPGIRDLPDYLKDYPKELERRKKANALRAVSFGNFSWSPKGTHGVLELRSQDNKDRCYYYLILHHES